MLNIIFIANARAYLWANKNIQFELINIVEWLLSDERARDACLPRLLWYTIMNLRLWKKYFYFQYFYGIVKKKTYYDGYRYNIIIFSAERGCFSNFSFFFLYNILAVLSRKECHLKIHYNTPRLIEVRVLFYTVSLPPTSTRYFEFAICGHN